MNNKQKKICKEHKLPFETYCFDCKGENEPMCSICLCDHNKNAHHINGNIHISTIIGFELQKIGDNFKNTILLQEQIKRYTKLAQDRFNNKEKLKEKIDDKLTQLKVFLKKQIYLASENNLSTLAYQEAINKEICKFESKMLTGHRNFMQNIEEMVNGGMYLEAHEKVKKADKENPILDDKEFNKYLKDYDKILKAFENQLESLEIAIIPTSEYSSMQKTITDLKGKIYKTILF